MTDALRKSLREDAQQLRASGGASLRKIAERIDEMLERDTRCADMNHESALDFVRQKQVRRGDLVLISRFGLAQTTEALDEFDRERNAIVGLTGARCVQVLVEHPRVIVMRPVDLSIQGLRLVEPGAPL